MKKNGSALIFSILTLSFFLAISLNIFFQARLKAKRSGLKLNNEVTVNKVDLASSIGYQELWIAETLVRKGILYDSTHPHYLDTYTLTNGTHLYLNMDSGFFTNRYSGIQISNYIDYFTSRWDHNDSDDQKLIIGENITSNTVNSRVWQSSGVASTLTPLWQLKIDDSSNSSRSLGGYLLIIEPTFTTTSTPLGTSATYEKIIRIDSSIINSITIPETLFKITVVESFNYIKDGSKIETSDREITNFIIETLN